MAFTPHELKNAAIKTHADLAARVTGAQREQRCRVDTRYTDFLGRDATCAANSIFVRS